MGKKNKTISCPYCGNQVIKEAFLKNGVCGHPDCGFDISNAPDVIEYFESIQRKEDYSDVFGDSYTMKRTKNNDEQEDEAPSFNVEAPDDIPEEVPASILEPEQEPEQVITPTPVQENVHVEENQSPNEDVDKEKRRKELELLMQRRAATKNKQQENTHAETIVHAEPQGIPEQNVAVEPVVEKPGLAEPITPKQEAPQMSAEEQIAFLKAELARKQKEIAATHAGDNVPEAPVEESNDFAPATEIEEELPVILENIPEEPEPESIEELKKKNLSPAERIRQRKKEGNTAIGSNEKLEKMRTPYNSNEDGYYNDTESAVPPEPDIIDRKAILRYIGIFVGLAALTAFLIMWA